MLSLFLLTALSIFFACSRSPPPTMEPMVASFYLQSRAVFASRYVAFVLSVSRSMVLERSREKKKKHLRSTTSILFASKSMVQQRKKLKRRHRQRHTVISDRKTSLFLFWFFLFLLFFARVICFIFNFSGCKLVFSSFDKGLWLVMLVRWW